MLDRLPYAAVGDGPVVVVLPGLSTRTGVESQALVRSAFHPVMTLARSHRLVLLNRRPGLARGMTMGDIASEHAKSLRSGFDGPVAVMATSTGGSIAQQLAAEHPDVVDRLVLVSSACRLGPTGRRLQAEAAAHIRAGQLRRAAAVIAGGVVPPYRGSHAAAAAGWLLAKRLVRRRADWDDLATTLEAEDEFDLAAGREPIQARTLILAGREDRFYTPELFEETARLIPNSDLRLFPKCGHITVTRDRGFRASLARFLA